MVNDHMGAMIADRGPVAAGAVALVLLFLTQPMSYLPKAVLGAVIVSAAIGLVDPGRLARAPAREPVRAGDRGGDAPRVVAPWRGWPNVPNRPCDAF